MGAKSDNFCLFSAYFGVFSPDLWMKYRVFISIVDISANIDIDINIDKEILKNIDIDKAILQNIDIDKILYRYEFGISNSTRSQSPTGILVRIRIIFPALYLEKSFSSSSSRSRIETRD